MHTILLLTALSAAPPPQVDDTHDVVLLTAKRPYRLRLHLRIEGRPFLAGWNQQMGQLLRVLDADGDGRVSSVEAKRAPGRDQWRQMSGASATIDPEEAPDFRDLARGKTHATLLDLQSYYGNSTGGPLQASWSWAVQPNPLLSDTLWAKLDTDRDGKLSRAELLAARKVLAPLDGDEDETVSMAELMGRPYGERAFLVTSGPAHGLAKGGLPLFSSRPGEPAADLDKATQTLYKRHINPTPDLELAVPLEGLGYPVRVIGGPPEGLRFAVTRYGECLITEDWFVEIVRPRPLRANEGPRGVPHEEAFRQFDENRDGFLSSSEIYRPPFALVSWLRLADRDGDGRLSKQEYLAFADLKKGIQGRVTNLRGEDLGPSLFRFLDEDGDGRLGPRELSQAWGRLSPWVAGRDVLDRKQLPRHFRLVLSHGAFPDAARQSPFVGPDRPTVPERGPVWFRKMDRNRDGDVSLKEWLGSAGQFRQIDGNDDGLIDLEEAERFDRARRGAK